MAIKNIGNFLPKENKIKITEENFEEYLTNSYLDTTQSRKEYFNLVLFATLILLFIMIFLLFFTIFDRDKIVNNLEEIVDETVKSAKKKQLKKKNAKVISSKQDKEKTEEEEII